VDILYRCCAGLDVHKKTVVACLRRIEATGPARQEVCTFGTMTCDLLALSDWLAEQGVQPGAMESTGVYWKPVFSILEGRFAVMPVNARHIQQVPGRKTDVKDCQWIAQLLQHGLLRASFVPPPPIRGLRDLTRQRSQLVAEKAAAANRIQKVLEDANIKLASVATDVLGVSGRGMLEALIAGEDDAEKLADKARERLRKKIPELQTALRGRVTAHHHFQLRILLDHVTHLEGLIGRLGVRIEELMVPFAEAVERLTTIPGVEQRAAEAVIAEIGVDMDQFPTAEHLASWAGMCPGNNESAGQRKTGKATKGSRWLRQVLTQAAWAASHIRLAAEAFDRLVATGHMVVVEPGRLHRSTLKGAYRIWWRLKPPMSWIFRWRRWRRNRAFLAKHHLRAGRPKPAAVEGSVVSR
jgi:transposase